MPKIPLNSSKPKTVAQLVKSKRQPSLAEVTRELDDIRVVLAKCSEQLLELTTKMMCFGINTPAGELPPVDDLPF